MPAVLNVGGARKSISLPSHYANWRHDLLDIDPRANPDILRDARELHSLPAGTYDAVHCSHNLEHFHRHDAVKVIRGFHHVLVPSGFAEIYVPDLAAVMRTVVHKNLDIDDVLYLSPGGPILVRDVIYGYHVEIERSGHDFFAHKTGFTPQSLSRFMVENGFPYHGVVTHEFNLRGYFFKQIPTPDQAALLNLRMG